MNKIVRFIAVGIVLMAMGWSVQFNGHHVSKSTMDGGALVFDTKEALKIYLKSKRLVQSVSASRERESPRALSVVRPSCFRLWTRATLKLHSVVDEAWHMGRSRFLSAESVW